MATAASTVIRGLVDVVQNKHDVDALGDFMKADFVDHGGMLGSGIESAKGFFTMLFAAFPDARFDVHDMVGDGDMVVTRKTFTGTHRAEFMGIPATGKSASIQIVDQMRVVDGKVVEHWAVVDMMGLMQQLGVAGG